MNFLGLHELVRLEMLARIHRGEFTGTFLAEQLGLRQAQISNYLNRKRFLSLESLDRVLAAQDLTIEALLSTQAVTSDSSLDGSSALEEQSDPYPYTGSKSAVDASDGVIEVPIVSSSSVVEEPQIGSSSIIETILLSSSHLLSNRSYPSPKRASWQRFVATRPDRQQIAAMRPLLAMGCIVVIDRHYNSFAHNNAVRHADAPPLYALGSGGSLLLRAVEFMGGHLILRAFAMDCPTQLITITATEPLTDYLIGRVCTILNEV